ncbi:MAG: hypothetical protein IT438_10815 [Phycisphaerales bacterium]|nr:hypothetical protein [Phycisphaerales bacterium]
MIDVLLLRAQHRHRRATAALWLFAVVVIGASCGCQSASGPYVPASEARRDSAKAEQLTRDAADLIDVKPDKAERLLREALTADLYHGPAHNNLGALLLSRGDLYAAAGEFEWARKLMPGSPDPRMNLALTLEKADRVDDALKTYLTALEVQPEHLPTVKAYTRLQIRSGKTDDHTHERLRLIAMRGDSIWRDWARLQQLQLAK